MSVFSRMVEFAGLSAPGLVPGISLATGEKISQLLVLSTSPPIQFPQLSTSISQYPFVAGQGFLVQANGTVLQMDTNQLQNTVFLAVITSG